MRALASVLAIAATVACGAEPERADSAAGEAAFIVRPAVEVDRKDRLVQSFADAREWTATGATPRLISIGGAEGDRSALQMTGAGRHLVTIRGPFQPGTFNFVSARVASPDRFQFSVLLRQGRKTLVDVDVLRWLADGGETRAIFDLRPFQDVEGPVDSLVLSALGEPTDWTLFQVDLFERPLEGWLPEPAGEADMMRIGEEERRGFGLTSRMPVDLELPRVPPGARLSFSYGAPDGFRGDGALDVRREGESSTLARLPLDPAAGWRFASIPLDELAGERVRLRFELFAHSPPMGCGIAELDVSVPDASAQSILLVTSDTHRGDHVGAAGLGVDVATPALDRLAENGIFFEDCFSSSNVTVASHTALMTGTHPRDTGVIDNERMLAAEATTLAEAFRARGYRTFGSVSVRHLSPDLSGLNQGFDRYFWPNTKENVAPVAIDRLIDWLGDVGGQPVFAWLHVFDAHTPYEPPRELERRYYPADKNPADPSLPRRTFPVPAAPGTGRIRDPEWFVAQYKSEVTFLDGELARALEHPLFANGIVAVTADHGESLSQHGIYWHHFGLYPDTIHVPLILRYPGVSAGDRAKRRVRQIDLGRTLLDLAGIENHGFPGRSLVAPEQDELPRFALGARGREASVNVGRWFLNLVLISFPKNKKAPDLGRFERHAVELYDLEADPTCETNLLDAEFDRAKEMRRQLVRWLTSAVDTGWSDEGTNTEETRELLAQLGYASDGSAAEASELFDPECACDQCARFE